MCHIHTNKVAVVPIVDLKFNYFYSYTKNTISLHRKPYFVSDYVRFLTWQQVVNSDQGPEPMAPFKSSESE